MPVCECALHPMVLVAMHHLGKSEKPWSDEVRRAYNNIRKGLLLCGEKHGVITYAYPKKGK